MGEVGCLKDGNFQNLQSQQIMLGTANLVSPVIHSGKIILDAITNAGGGAGTASNITLTAADMNNIIFLKGATVTTARIIKLPSLATVNAGDRVILDGTDSSSSNAGDGIDLQDGTFGGTVDLSAVDQDIIPDQNNARNLGSSTKRFNDLFLAGDTIDLAGATISSDGTGSISIAATGATLPAGSKAGDNQLAVVSSSGETIQPARVVPFFSAAGGLSTPAKKLTFKASSARDIVYKDTFTKSNGSSLSATNATQLFEF